MSSKIELFKIDPTTRLATLDLEWITTIKEFKAIVRRDRGSEGDAQGRIKLQATKELTFIYHYCDYNSKFANYEHKEKKLAALKNSDLPEDLDIEKDEALMEAIIRYKSLQVTPSLKTLEEVREGLYSAYKVARKIRLHLEDKLETLDIDEYVEKNIGNKVVQVSALEAVKDSLDYLLSLTQKLPKSIASLDELEEKIKIEMTNSGGLRGDKMKGVREDGASVSMDQGKLQNNLFAKS